MKIVRMMFSLLTPGQHKSVLVLLGLMVVGMVLETLGVGLIIPAVTVLLQDDLAASFPVLQPLLTLLGNPTHTQLAVGGMLGLIVIYLLKNLFLVYFAWWQHRFADGVQVNLAERLFATYLRQPYTFHLQRNSAELIRNITTEVGTFQGTLLNIISLITEGGALACITAVLLAVEPLGTLIVVVVVGGAVALSHRFTHQRLGRWGELRMYHVGLFTQHLMQGFGGAKDIKLLGREDDFLNQFGVHITESARMTRNYNVLLKIPRMWLEQLAVTGLALLVMTLVVLGRDPASIVPTLALFAVAAFRFLPGMNRMVGAIQGLRFSRPAIDTISADLQLPVPAPTEGSVRVGSGFQTEVRVSDVSYTYATAGSPALRGLTLAIGKGESVGFVGPSGSGKSTLVDVILGLLTPSSGRVSVDGMDIQTSLRGWQDQIGYVPQAIYLTDDTLRRNVAFGLAPEQIDDGAVDRAVIAAQMGGFVSSLPDGLETVVGERGVRLSGGQRQRIGIARALYHDPEILVLDEATSSLDNTTERDVMEGVNALHGSKTILIVSHRMSTVENCDRLYRLDQGRIVEEGNPKRMLNPRAGVIQTPAEV